jgi:hypothetical protein
MDIMKIYLASGYSVMNGIGRERVFLAIPAMEETGFFL